MLLSEPECCTVGLRCRDDPSNLEGSSRHLLIAALESQLLDRSFFSKMQEVHNSEGWFLDISSLFSSLFVHADQPPEELRISLELHADKLQRLILRNVLVFQLFDAVPAFFGSVTSSALSSLLLSTPFVVFSEKTFHRRHVSQPLQMETCLKVR